MTKAKEIRCMASEGGDRCKLTALRKATIGQVIVYSCMKPHRQWAHLKPDRWEVFLPKDWDKEPRRTQEGGKSKC